MPSKSKSQQRLMNWAKGVKSGSVKDAPAKVKKVASSMSMSELDKFGKLVGDIKKKRKK
jgi:hypothetical protein